MDNLSLLKGDSIQDEQMFNYKSGINNLGGKIDFDYNPNPRHKIKFGINYLYYTFTPGGSILKITNKIQDIKYSLNNKITYANVLSCYAEDTWDVTGLLKINYGVHYSGFFLKEKFYHSFEPRIGTRLLLNDKLSLKLSYSHMSQHVHLLTNATLGLPTDLWLPSTDSIPPELSKQIALGINYNINNNYILTVEGYYKKMDNIVEYKDGASFFQITKNWGSKIEIGQGYAYGCELLFKKNYGKITGWIGYTLSWSWRKFENINFGKPFPYKYDRRHDLSIVLLYKINKKIDIGLTWVYGTGNAITLSTLQYRSLGLDFRYDLFSFTPNDVLFLNNTGVVHYYEGRNTYRMPSYNRLDLNININKKLKRGIQTWSFGLYNAYNRQNPFNAYLSYRGNQPIITLISLFPIIPFVKYDFKF